MQADVNVHDNLHNTPLIWTAFLARSEVMKILLRCTTSNIDALQSVSAGCCVIYRHGADVQLTDREGRTALHWAMKTPLIHCLKLLCKHFSMGVENKLVGCSVHTLHTPLHSSCHLPGP